jgi:hypothetical protein
VPREGRFSFSKEHNFISNGGEVREWNLGSVNFDKDVCWVVEWKVVSKPKVVKFMIERD